VVAVSFMIINFIFFFFGERGSRLPVVFKIKFDNYL
jgi:hypothetical protein